MKFILLFSLLICTNLLVFGQTVHQVNTIQIANWDRINEKWVWDDEQDADLTITIDGSTITLNNIDRTTITTTSFISEQKNVREVKSIYNALDQAGRKCTLIFAKGVVNGKKSIAIMYPSSITVLYRFN